LYKATQARAALSGKDYATPEDVRFVAPYVLMHRLNIGGGARSASSSELLDGIIAKVKVPIEG